MGEIAEAMINGLFCERCGVLIDGEEPGFPRLCAGCQEDDDPSEYWLDQDPRHDGESV